MTLFQPYLAFLANFLEWASLTLLSPNLILSQKDDKLNLDNFAKIILGLSCLSWAVGLYLLGLSYNWSFLVDIVFIGLSHYIMIVVFGRLLCAYIDRSIEKRQPNSPRHFSSLEKLWKISSLPWLFFTPLTLINNALVSGPTTWFLVFLVAIWLISWSFCIFYLSLRELYDLPLRELHSVLIRSFAIILSFPLFILSWFMTQVYAILA